MYTVFLSSTFNDMQRERDAFHRVILPKINSYTSQFGEAFQLCDLRWGVDTTDVSEEESTAKILDVCFDSIDRSVPFFVVMIGDRYGWVPPESTEDNISGYGLEYHGQSVTEMEIEYQSVVSRDRECRALYFFRESLPVEEMTGESKALYFTGKEEDRKKLEGLKAKILRENPGRVFTYKAPWSEEEQSYSTEEFSELAFEKLRDVIGQVFADTPCLSDEEKVLNESAAYYRQRAHVHTGNIDLLVKLFTDLLTQMKGKTEFANEKMRAVLEAAGELKECEESYKFDPYRGVVISCAKGSESFNSALYQFIYENKIDISDESFFPIPFVANVNRNACTARQLLACIIKALELKVLSLESIERRADTDVCAVVRELIEYRPYGKYPEGTMEGERYYLEKLLGYLRKKRVIPFLLCDRFELLAEADRAAKDLEFLTASGVDSGYLYMLLNMTESCYESMNYLRSIEGHFVYRTEPLKESEIREYIKSTFSSQGKELSKKVTDALAARPESGNVVWLRSACDDLCEMDTKDFYEARSIGSGALAIESVLLSKVKGLPSSVEELLFERMMAFSETVDADLLSFVLKLVSLAEFGVSASVIEKVAGVKGIRWNSLDYELIVSRFSHMLRRSESGSLSFLDKDLRDHVRKRLCAEELARDYFHTLKKEAAGDADTLAECISAAVVTRDARWMWKLVDEASRFGESDKETLLRAVEKALEGGGEWLAEDTDMELPEGGSILFCKDFYSYLIKKSKQQLAIPVMRLMSLNSSCPAEAYIRARLAYLRFLDESDEHQRASAEFGEIYELLQGVWPELQREAVEAVSFYAYVSMWYHKDEKELYAQRGYDMALALPKTKENATTVIRAIYRWILVFSPVSSIEEVNEKYQQIFDYYEDEANELCHRYDKRHKRFFFYDLKLAYMDDCADICESYASFLAKNYRKVPEGTTVPCHRMVATGGFRGDLYSKADGVEHRDEASYEDASIVYRRYAQALSSSLYSATHSEYWLSFWSNCQYNQGLFKKRTGRVKYRTGDAYESFENAARGYEMLERQTGSEHYREKYRLYRADSLAQMGEVAKGFTDKAYADLSKNGYAGAYELYCSLPEEMLSPSQKELYIDSCISYASSHEDGEKYTEKALSLLKSVSKVDARMYFRYYSCYIDKCNRLCERQANELIGEDVQHIALTAAMISRHMFFGLSEKTADKRRSTHMSVARWIATLYAQNKVVTGRDLYMTLCGYCCELLYCRITNKPNRQEILRYILDNSIGSDMAITVCKILEDDEIIEKVRK